MAPLIVPNGIRVSISGFQTGSHPWACVFGGKVDVAGDAETLAHDIADAFLGSLFENCTNSTSVEAASWVDLRTEDGDSGPVPDLDLPANGLNTEAGGALQVAYLIHWAVPGGRNTRPGRTYLPGVAEASVAPGGALTGDLPGDIISSITSFLAACSSGGNGDLAVISNPTTGDPVARVVTAGTLDPVVATQRRRQRR